MTKRFACYLAPIVLAGCVTQQPRVRNEQPAVAPTAQVSQQQAGAPRATTAGTLLAAPAPVRAISPQLQRAVEDTVLCRIPVQPNELSEKMKREGVFAGPATRGDAGSAVYRPRTPILIVGMPIKEITFWGDSESDSGQWVSVTVDGKAQAVAKSLADKGVKLRKAKTPDVYEYKGAKTGTVQVMTEKNGIIRIGCAVGLD
jgi:hypothetical protein